MPGFTELLGADTRTLLLLILSFSLTFVNDTVAIYAVMWLAGAEDLDMSKKGEKHFNGLQVGSLYLTLYIIVDNWPFPKKILKIKVLAIAMTLFSVFLAYSAFITYSTYNFLYFIVGLALLNQFHRSSIV